MGGDPERLVILPLLDVRRGSAPWPQRPSAHHSTPKMRAASTAVRHRGGHAFTRKREGSSHKPSAIARAERLWLAARPLNAPPPTIDELLSLVERRVEAFSASAATCYLREEREQLLGVIESSFGSLVAFDAELRRVFLKVIRQQRRLIQTHLESTPRAVKLGSGLCKAAVLAASPEAAHLAAEASVADRTTDADPIDSIVVQASSSMASVSVSSSRRFTSLKLWAFRRRRATKPIGAGKKFVLNRKSTWHLVPKRLSTMAQTPAKWQVKWSPKREKWQPTLNACVQASEREETSRSSSTSRMPPTVRDVGVRVR